VWGPEFKKAPPKRQREKEREKEREREREREIQLLHEKDEINSGEALHPCQAPSSMGQEISWIPTIQRQLFVSRHSWGFILSNEGQPQPTLDS
jgi:hypothetical protein